MSAQSTLVTHYHASDRQVAWRGVGYADGDGFNTLMTERVAARVRDDEGNQQFEALLRGVANTGFALGNLQAILEEDQEESRDWAIGEALAEVHLTEEHGIIWPWNTERDKRNPSASLPGADLVGLQTDQNGSLLALGEVKCSSEAAFPPQVMSGRSGMVHQLDTIANDLSILGKLLKWLFFRCKGTEHEPAFKNAIQRLLQSDNRSIALFGVLIRDTTPQANDLKNRGLALANRLLTPTTCTLTALHLPCPIADLPARCNGGVP